MVASSLDLLRRLRLTRLGPGPRLGSGTRTCVACALKLIRPALIIQSWVMLHGLASSCLTRTAAAYVGHAPHLQSRWLDVAALVGRCTISGSSDTGNLADIGPGHVRIADPVRTVSVRSQVSITCSPGPPALTCDSASGMLTVRSQPASNAGCGPHLAPVKTLSGTPAKLLDKVIPSEL